MSGHAGCQEGQEGQLGCASPKQGGSDFPAGLGGLQESCSGLSQQEQGAWPFAVLPLLRTKIPTE